MLDIRKLEEIATTICDHSLEVKEGHKVYIRTYPACKDLTKVLIREIQKRGAMPFIELIDDELKKEQIKGSNPEMWETKAKWEQQIYDDIDSICVIRPRNDIEMGEAGPNMAGWSKPIMGARRTYINHRRWVLLIYPTELMAYQFGMSQDQFRNYWTEVCSVDYKQMNENCQPLKRLMERTDKVRIVGPGTDVSFSIKGIPATICSGERNIPDGEVYTAPIKNSVNGHITYNIQSPYAGEIHNGVRLDIENGYIKSFSGDKPASLEKIFATDEGARYIGEFAIGVNNAVTEGVGNILFDEKMSGSIHFTPGNAYEGSDNGNRSAVHWDLVLSQQAKHGGGEIWFDDVLVRKDGIFMLEELKGLNPVK